MELENKIELQKNDKNENKYHKCEKCGSSILISIFYNKKKTKKEKEYIYPSLIYRCQNNHVNFNNKTLANTYYETLKEFSKKCSICKSNKNIFFCNECEKYFCYEHKNNDKCIIEHELIKCCTKTNYCDLHEINYSFYCNDCLTGFCEKCFDIHKIHYYTKLNKNLYFNNDDLKKFENQIQECKNFIKNYEKKINLCIKELNNILNIFKNNNEIQIKLCENLLNSYKNSFENNIIDYDIIKNINNIFNFNLQIKFPKFEKNNIYHLNNLITFLFDNKNTILLKKHIINLVSRTQINKLLRKYNNEHNKYYYDIKYKYKKDVYIYGEINRKNNDLRIGFLFKNNGYEFFEGNLHDGYGKYKFRHQNFIGKLNFNPIVHQDYDNAYYPDEYYLFDIIKDGKGILYEYENKFTGEWKDNLKIK